MGALEAALRARRDAGGRSFVPYVTGGFPGVDAALLRALEAAGADAVEVGIPFSDPVMDGGVIQEASRRALEAGHPSRRRPRDRSARPRLSIPVAVMTYVNPVFRRGIDAFLDAARAAGVAGVIVPDLPVDEACELEAAATAWRSTPSCWPPRGPRRNAWRRSPARAHGFVYCVATYGVTGARESLSSTAAGLVVGAAPPHRPPAPRGRGHRHAGAGLRGLRLRRRRHRGERPDGEMVDGDRAALPGLVAEFRGVHRGPVAPSDILAPSEFRSPVEGVKATRPHAPARAGPSAQPARNLPRGVVELAEARLGR